jgi:hypothetical protein
MEEQNDGSAILEIDMTEEEKNFLINYAINDILRKQINAIKDGENGAI